MAGSHIIKKIVTFLLILVLSQKMGMGLYLHNWLHASKSHDTAAAPLTSEELKNACSCITDFTAPLTETAEQEIPLPRLSVFAPAAVAVYALPVVYKYYHSLRAPPAPLS